MRIKRVISALIAAVLISVFCAGISASPLDLSGEFSLTTVYRLDGKAYEGLEIKTYRVAEMYDDFTFELTGDFADYPVNIYGIASKNEWLDIADTLSAYIEADGLTPTSTALTDADGAARHEGLQSGMYLTVGVRSHTGEYPVGFESFLTVVPSPEGGENGEETFLRDVTVYPKGGEAIPREGEAMYKVLKNWRDGGKTKLRSDSVKIEIFKDGVSEKAVTLSRDNNWSYSWIAQDGGTWTVVERDVPYGYTVTVSDDGYSFVVTNTHESTEDNPPENEVPKTGRTSSVSLYVVIMCISGMAMIILAIARKKCSDSE